MKEYMKMDKKLIEEYIILQIIQNIKVNGLEMKEVAMEQ